MPFYRVGGFFIPQDRVVATGQKIEDEHYASSFIPPEMPRKFDPTKEQEIFMASRHISQNYRTYDPQMTFCLLSTPEAREPRDLSMTDTILPDGSLNLLATVFVQRWKGPDEWPAAIPGLRQYKQDEITDISKKQLEDIGLTDLEFITTVVNKPSGWSYAYPPKPATP
ncbi:hypothetical protein FIBSPDRAFT_1047910 [Athelia psychrophila]|uniref:Uncharacterized protein n=1 Tax=Athelia psychrophila TaxID=1759441 RepID=A0A166EKE6_9AGAM|nr:hypothetical protein FIBSPDRAFT_1047910 [Fibularhizoctonia sp. CBS 109695]